MNEDAAFVSAIVDRPWDEPLRQVYADWLEEQGDPRAEYLRVESEAVALLRYRPLAGADARRGRELQYRLQALRQHLDAQWLAAVGRPDWILVKGGDPDTTRAAAVRHSELFRPPDEKRLHEVTLFRLGDRRFGLRFAPPLHPYFFCNLIGWLGDPEFNRGVEDATGWLTSPGTGWRYFLTQRPLQVGGDTILGVSWDGTPVQVELPEGTLSRVSHDRSSVEEPRWSPAECPPPLEFTVSYEALGSWGNPLFVGA